MFQPILPGTGLTSWNFYQSNKDDQLASYGQTAVVQRETTNFVQRIAKIGSVDDLMKDYQALKVTLGAFGLQDDIPNRYFVKKVITEGVASDDAFANHLSDGRYHDMAATLQALGVTGEGDFADSLSKVDPALSAAVAKVSGSTSPLYIKAAQDMQSQLNLAVLAGNSADNVWMQAMQNDDLVAQIKKGLGLADSFNGLPDKQKIGVIRDTMEHMFGTTTISTLANPANAFEVADRYLGTYGANLSDAFSFGGLRDSISTITNAVGTVGDATTLETQRWTRLVDNTALRDVVANALGVDTATLDAQSSSQQIATLQDATKAKFGRSDFSVFTVQENQRALGDLYLQSDASGRSDGFTLGAFTATVAGLNSAGGTVENRWQGVLGIAGLASAFKEAYGLGSDYDAMSEADKVKTLMAQTRTRFGSEDATTFQDIGNLAQLAGLKVDAQVKDITERYIEQSYRVAIGDVQPEMRVAMSVSDEINTAVDAGGTDTGAWYRVLGSGVLREVMETAFSLPDSFSQLDIDKQVEILKSKVKPLAGASTVAALQDPGNQEELISLYLSKAQAAAQTSITNPALALFTTATPGSLLATLYGQ